MDRRQFVIGALGVAMAGNGFAQATGNAWSPSKPVRIVAGAAGGILDVAARQLADKLQPALGQAVIVDNKAGGGGVVTMETVKASAPDGHTVGMTTFVEMTINPWIYDRLPYDPIKDFAPVTVLYSGQIMLVAHPSFPGESLADLIRLAKAQPGKYFYASSGVARPPHVWVERFKSTAGIDLTHVPFKGAGPLTQAVLTGEVPLAMEGVPALLPHVKAGKLKALAVTGDRRLAALPDLPTFAEAGVPGIGMTWVGLVAPAGTPAAAIERLNREVVRVLQSPEIKAAYEQAGRIVIGNTPDAFTALIRKELPEWGAIVKATGIRPE
jgi:tripartite-type tricarboxylate transporter receptor subunit TctC